MTSGNRRVVARCAIVGVGLLAGCFGQGPRQHYVVTDPDPASKIPAIKRSVSDQDLSVARQLIKDLDSDDSAVRFYAIQGLRRITGKNFGYRYYADESQRRKAQDRWRAWLAQREGSQVGATQPAAASTEPTTLP